MTKYLLIAAAAALASPALAQEPVPAPQAQAAPEASLRGNRLQADQTRSQALQRADLMFQRLDSNRDGTLTREEAQSAGPQMGRGGPRVERLMTRLFGDAQSVTQAQFQAQALARFDRLDLDRNGVITAAERQQGRGAR